MRREFLVTTADVEKLKQQARILKKANGISHHEALDQVAKSVGFDHWHHVAESAKTFAPTEAAYYFGVIIAMDMKDAQGFRDETGAFVEDHKAFALCADDLYWAMCEAIDDDGVPLCEKFSLAELKEWADEDLRSYGFFRFTGRSIPEHVEEVIALVRKYSFWPPQYIWHKGVFHESPSNASLDEEGRGVGIRFCG
ncbi:hypothetical protein ACUHMQ_12885 [Chitinimonas sp. PSY-7]|uniref:hypothetical protein n=1 Tax=Chitinimonas sp. PSY-7 TaxID=3459088 RepID=UPI00403FF8BF